jgi:hypothetical protein
MDLSIFRFPIMNGHKSIRVLILLALQLNVNFAHLVDEVLFSVNSRFIKR